MEDERDDEENVDDECALGVVLDGEVLAADHAVALEPLPHLCFCSDRLQKAPRKISSLCNQFYCQQLGMIGRMKKSHQQMK